MSGHIAIVPIYYIKGKNLLLVPVPSKRFYRLFGLQVCVFFCRIEARTIAIVTQVSMPDDQGAGVTLVEIFKQLPHRRLLFSSARVGGLTADVEPAFVADADRMGIVVQTVRTYHPFRATRLNLSVTTDHVVVADAEVETPLAMPGINLSGRRSLVGLYCRTMNNFIQSF